MIELRNQAAIVGYGHVPFGKRGEHAEKGHLRLVIEAVAAACADAGITPKDVTYTRVERPIVPELAALGSYNSTVVELEHTNGVVRVLSRVTGVARDDLFIGLRVGVHFDPAGDGVALPVFRPR